MSLRIRLLASIIVALLVGLAIGGATATWNAARSVSAELQAALAVGEQTVRHGLDDLPASRDPPGDLTRLVRAFDGDRHLRAMLIDATGRDQEASTSPRPAQAAPDWFVHLVAPVLASVRLPVMPGAGMVVLMAEPLNEVSEVWTQLRSSLATLTVSWMLSAALVSLVVGRAVRPLEQLSSALTTVGSGTYAVRLARGGAPELARLADGFNAMAERLGAAEAQNRRLHEQLMTLQDEERADLARDLHDEVGPFLFTVALDAAAIEQAVAAGRHAAIPDRAQAIRDAVGHMQRHVRGMLGRLRTASPVELGLRPALGNLVAFWQAHRPAVAFTLDVMPDEDRLDEATKAVIYRIAQEGLSNAIRHGQPARIDVAVGSDLGHVVVRVSDDGVGLAALNEPGFGLVGMRERVAALGGSLRIASGEGGRGLTVTARLPGLGHENTQQAADAA